MGRWCKSLWLDGFYYKNLEADFLSKRALVLLPGQMHFEYFAEGFSQHFEYFAEGFCTVKGFFLVKLVFVDVSCALIVLCLMVLCVCQKFFLVVNLQFILSCFLSALHGRL